MARSVSVQTLIDEIRSKTSDPDGALAGDTLLIAKISAAWARLYSYYVQAEPDRFRTEETLTMSGSGDNPFDLPADWFSTIGVDYVNGTCVEPVLRLQEHERRKYSGAYTATRAERYRLGATTLTLFPTPAIGQTYTHIYLPTAPVLTSTGTLIDCRIGHEEFITMYVSRNLLELDESYDGKYDAQLEKIEQELRQEADMRYLQDASTREQPDDMEGNPYFTCWRW